MAAASSTTPPLDGRVAIVSGGSRGIGREVSSHLAAVGARVVVNYASSPAKAEELVARSPRVAVRADVSDAAAVRALFDHAEEAFGSPPHIVVACAGIMDAKYPALADTAVEDFDATFAVNTRGKFLVCQEAARRIPLDSGGRIVTFSSSTVATLPPGYAAYAASNAAVEAMTRILAKEVAAKGITANVVAPGPVNTELFFAGKDEVLLERMRKSMGRVAETTEIAPVVSGDVPSERGLVLGERSVRLSGSMGASRECCLLKTHGVHLSHYLPRVFPRMLVCLICMLTVMCHS